MYTEYEIEKDIFKHRKHIFYLFARDKTSSNITYCLCTYSVKTKRLIIKCANKHIPPTNVLQQFIEMAETQYVKNN